MNNLFKGSDCKLDYAFLKHFIFGLKNLPEIVPQKEIKTSVLSFTSDERSFLAQLAQGYSYHQIATVMNVRVNTVRGYVSSVCNKLGVNSLDQAAAKFLGGNLGTETRQQHETSADKAEAVANFVGFSRVAPTAPTLKSRIFLIDDHAMFREGLKQLINHEPDLMVCGDVAEAEKALKSIEELKPDLAISDLSLSGRTGMELVKSLKAQHRDLPVLVVSMHEESIYAERVLRAGAGGYVMKHEPARTLKLAIRKVIGGDVHLSEKMYASLLNKSLRGVQPEPSSSPAEKLSDRELQVFQMLGQGKMTRHIAKELGLRHVTVYTFRQRIMKKLNLKHSFELVLLANKWTHEGNCC